MGPLDVLRWREFNIMTTYMLAVTSRSLSLPANRRRGLQSRSCCQHMLRVIPRNTSEDAELLWYRYQNALDLKPSPQMFRLQGKRFTYIPSMKRQQMAVRSVPSRAPCSLVRTIESCGDDHLRIITWPCLPASHSDVTS